MPYIPKPYPLDTYLKLNLGGREISAENYRTTSQGMNQALANLAQTIIAMRELDQRKNLAEKGWANQQIMQDKQNFADLNRTNVENVARMEMQDKALQEQQYEHLSDQDLRERIFQTQTQTENQRIALEAADQALKGKMLGLDMGRLINETQRTAYEGKRTDIAETEAKASRDYQEKTLKLKEKDMQMDADQRRIANMFAGAGLALQGWEARNKAQLTREGFDKDLLATSMQTGVPVPYNPVPTLTDYLANKFLGIPLPAAPSTPTSQPSIVDTVDLPEEDKAKIRALPSRMQDDATRLKMAERAPEREEQRTDYNKAKAALAAVQNGKLVGKPIEILSAFADARKVGAMKEITPELQQIETATRKSLLGQTIPEVKAFTPSEKTWDSDLATAYRLLSQVKLSDAPDGQKNKIEDEITNKLLDKLPSHVTDTELRDYFIKLDAINKIKADIGSKPVGITDYQVYPVFSTEDAKATKGYHFRSRKAMSPEEYARMKETIFAN